jgi:hypothetical protein
LDSQQNGGLYGKDTSAEDILQIRRTRRPAAFNRFVRVMARLLLVALLPPLKDAV